MLAMLEPTSKSPLILLARLVRSQRSSCALARDPCGKLRATPSLPLGLAGDSAARGLEPRPSVPGSCSDAVVTAGSAPGAACGRLRTAFALRVLRPHVPQLNPLAANRVP